MAAEDDEPSDVESVEAEFDNEQLDEDIWSDVYGHKAGKAVVSAALRQGDVHVLLVGPPGSGKSAFLLALDSRVPGVIYRDGDQITASKLRDVLKDDPPILLIDEIDALDSDAYDVLSIPMEHGRLVRDSARESYDVEVGTQVIGACNHAESLPEHIQNRFRPVEFEKYDNEEYVNLCGKMLVDTVDWIDTEDQARRAARKVLEITGEPDPRTARDICRMSRSVDEIGTLSQAMENPDADIDVEPLFPGEIARAQGEVGKVHLRRVLTDEMIEQSQRGRNGGEEDAEEQAERADGAGGEAGMEQIEQEIEDAVADSVS